MKPASAEMVANLGWFTQGLGFPEFYRSGSIRPLLLGLKVLRFDSS